MRYINPMKAGIAVGTVVGLWHLVWASLVAVGWAQPILDFILRLHFITLQYELAPFAIGTAVTLVVLTFCVGAVFGLAFAVVWNWLAGAAGEPRKANRTTAAA